MVSARFLIVLSLMSADAGAWAREALPPAVQDAWEAHARRHCRDTKEKYLGAKFVSMPLSGVDGSALSAGEARYLTADFNGDGRPDFAIATPNGGCAGINERHRGSQLVVDFVLSSAGGYAADSQRDPDGYRTPLVVPFISPSWIQRRGKADVLRYETGSAGAGRCGPLPTEAVWGWNGRGIDVLERYDARRRAVDEEGCMVQAANPAVEQIPAAAKAE